MQGLRWLDRALARIEDGLLIAAVAVIATLVGLGVVLRYVFNDPLTWSEEFVITLFVWSVMLGVPSALRSRMHIRVDALILRLNPLGRRIAGVIACVAAAVIFIATIYAGIMHTENVWASTTPMLDFSFGWIFISLPVSFSLLMFHALVILLDEGPEAVFRNETESVVDSAQA
jgi:TRAP-type C4-dicarboxylate transport system permease small subunit